MAASPPPEAVRALAQRAAVTAGLVLEDVSVTPMGRRRVLRVVVDLPGDVAGGVPMDAVAEASQVLSTALDQGDAMGGGPYVLEVSSPGVDRPLTHPRHFARARGRLVRVVRRDGGVTAGRLVRVDDDGVGFEDGTSLCWDDVVTGGVEVEFSRPSEAGDDEEEGARG